MLNEDGDNGKKKEMLKKKKNIMCSALSMWACDYLAQSTGVPNYSLAEPPAGL